MIPLRNSNVDEWAHRSESDVDADVEAAIRWERSEVDEPVDVLVSEVRNFGVEAPILRPVVEIAPAEIEPDIARMAGEPVGDGLRHAIRQRHFAQLHE